MLDSKFSPAILEAEDAEIKPVGGFDSQNHAAKSNAMRRILGLDGTGIMTVVQRTRAISDLGSVFKSKPVSSLPGLGNWDHSCYQNSVIQGLASLECLPGFLHQEDSLEENEAEKRTERPTRKALRELTQRLNDVRNVGKTFWTPSELKSMSSWQQQDAQEYFSKMMDGLDKDAAKAKSLRSMTKGFEALSVTDGESEDGRALTPQTSRMSQLPEELQSVMARNPLEGLLAQRVGCQQCGYVEGLSLVPFNCLTVPLGRQWIYDVRECLDEYTALEPINGVECAKCTLLRARTQMSQILERLSEMSNLDGKDDYNSHLATSREDTRKRLELVIQALDDEDFIDSTLKKCQIPAKSYVSTTKSRQAVVARAPKALAVHINRSIFDEMTGEQSKNHATVKFPNRFSLGPWCLGSQNEDSKETGVENWNTDPRESMISDTEDSNDLSSVPSYELRAVVTHYGRHENGHYICYRRSPYLVKRADDEDAEESAPWWRLSDEEVTEVSEDTVLAQGGVFMLFYEQVPASDRTVVAPVLQETPDMTAVNAFLESMQGAADNPADGKRPMTVDLEADSNVAMAKPVVSAPPGVAPETVKEEKTLLAPLLDAKDLGTHASSPAAHDLPPAADTAHQPIPGTPPPEVSVEALAPNLQMPRIISPRTGRGNGRRTGKAMEQMAGFVHAN